VETLELAAAFEKGESLQDVEMAEEYRSEEEVKYYSMLTLI